MAILEDILAWTLWLLALVSLVAVIIMIIETFTGNYSYLATLFTVGVGSGLLSMLVSSWYNIVKYRFKG